MKIKKAVTLYGLRVMSIGSFFPEYKNIFFKSKAEAVCYRDSYYPGIEVREQFAVEDKDNNDQDRWVLINLDQKISEPIETKTNHYTKYQYAGELVAALATHPNSVFAVEEKSRFDCSESGGGDGMGIGGWWRSISTIVLDGADEISYKTKLLFANGKEEWLITRGEEVTLVSAVDLVNRKKLEENADRLQALLAEQERLLEEQEHLNKLSGFKF